MGSACLHMPFCGMLTLWVLRDTVHFSPAWAFPLSITAKCDALGFLCLWPGRSKPSFKIYTGIRETDHLEVPCLNFCQQTISSSLLSLVRGVREGGVSEKMIFQEIPGFRLECLKSRTSPKSLTFWWMNMAFCFSVFKMRKAASEPHANFSEIPEVLSSF